MRPTLPSVRLATIERRDGPGLAVVEGKEVADLTAVAPDLPRDMAVLLGMDGGIERLAEAAARAPRLLLEDVRLLAPVLRPPKFLAIGLNYAKHVEESGMPAPEHQLWFNKQSTCVVGPGAAIEIPRDAPAMVDYEGELAFVIGKRCRHVSRADAGSVIAGYTIVNDVSVRDWQFRSPTMTMGKSWDTHGPTGPWLVTPDELGDPHTLRLRTWVNDELRQDGNTDDLIFDCFDMVEHLSTAFTLEPGDLISTGTPSGVGMAMQPPKLLQPGEVVRIEIEGIGTLENPVVAEP
jgi:2-keto-4-pentenoate hydratase/2-oxohepta-3-ene-1,7-dioic acid hydratase in catechol pathway